ncbi:MAG TPA: TonB-dependent copper receptor, partial [Lysobacter sp.]
NADAAAAWTPDEHTLVEATLGRGDGQARYAGRGMDGSKFERDSTGLRFERREVAGPIDRIEATAYRNRADHVMDNYSLRSPNPASAMPIAMASNVQRTTTGGRAAMALEVAAVSLVVGLDTQESRHATRSAAGRGAYSTQPFVNDAVLRNSGVFGEATWALGPAQRLVTGARFDRAQADDERPTAGMMRMSNPTRGMTRKETLGAGFARFEFGQSGKGVSYYAGLGHTERMPDYWELFSAQRGPAGSINAFTGLETEKTTQLDVGFQYKSAGFDAWGSAYAGRMHDYILFDYVPGGMMGTSTVARNIDAAIHGAEAGLAWKPAMHWRVESSVAWAWGENRTQHRALPQMSPFEARLGVNWDDHERWSAGALLRAAARQDRVAIGQGNVVGRDLGGTPGFATLAVNAAYRINDVARVTAGVDNVFDRYYAEHLNLAGSADFGYPADPVRIAEPGRTAWVRLAMSY